MLFPSADELTQILFDIPLEDVVNEHLFRGPPFVFRDQPELFQTLNHHLCRNLSLKEEAVIIVGSAKMGFSLAPDNFPRQFSQESDIDVLVVTTSPVNN